MIEETGLLLTNRQLRELRRRFEPGATDPAKDVPLQKQTFRSLFLSDTHLGRSDCKSDRLTVFLDLAIVKDTFYLVGDIIDWWFFRASQPHHLGRIFQNDTHVRAGLKFLQYGLHLALRQVKLDILRPAEPQAMRWPQAHNDGIQKILRVARHAHTILMGGNHDELLRGLANALHRMGAEAEDFLKGSTRQPDNNLRHAYFKSPSMGNLDVVQEGVYEALHGEHLHVCHGDRFDPPFQKSRYLGILATRMFHGGVVPAVQALGFREAADRLTNYVNCADNKDTSEFYDRYADFLDKENRKIASYNTANPDREPRPTLRGGIHGHKHNPGVRRHRGYVFIDSGDFVHHCTAAVEHEDGRFQIMTANREAGIVPHPVTPNPVRLFAEEGPMDIKGRRPCMPEPVAAT